MGKIDIQKVKEYLKNMTPERKKTAKQKTIQGLKEKLSKKDFRLVRWRLPKDNPNWSHDHCEFCMKHISDKPGSENEAYTDEKGEDWVCKDCFKRYLVKNQETFQD